MNMEKILVSACLLGVSCRYDGSAKPNDMVIALKDKYDLIPVCPEIMGGLPTPRPPAEILCGNVINRSGEDVTAAFKKGAGETLYLAGLFGCKKAVLKENSPSCGFGMVYDGTFSKTLVDGSGIAARLLSENGVEVFGENKIEEL